MIGGTDDFIHTSTMRPGEKLDSRQFDCGTQLIDASSQLLVVRSDVFTARGERTNRRQGEMLEWSVAVRVIL